MGIGSYTCYYAYCDRCGDELDIESDEPGTNPFADDGDRESILRHARSVWRVRSEDDMTCNACLRNERATEGSDDDDDSNDA